MTPTITPTVLFDLDGEPVAASECDWQLVGPCGCVHGLLVADLDCLTDERAWVVFFPRKRDRIRRRNAGWAVRLDTRAAGVALHLQAIRAHPAGDPRQCGRTTSGD